MIKIWPNKVLVETISNETINKIFTKINNYEITLYLLNNQVWTKIKTIPLDEYINHIVSSLTSMGTKINQFTIDQLNITLDNRFLVKSQINVTMSFTINGINSLIKHSNVIIYNNIGSTM